MPYQIKEKYERCLYAALGGLEKCLAEEAGCDLDHGEPAYDSCVCTYMYACTYVCMCVCVYVMSILFQSLLALRDSVER